jgi:hypothetical protein
MKASSHGLTFLNRIILLGLIEKAHDLVPDGDICTSQAGLSQEL